MKNRRGLGVIISVFFMTFIVLGAIWGHQHPTISSHEKQLTFLKEHEADMTQFIKAQNPKIESVQFDWDSVETGYIGNGTPQGGGKNLTIYGTFNGFSDSSWMLGFAMDKGKIVLESMSMFQPLRVGGMIYE